MSLPDVDEEQLWAIFWISLFSMMTIIGVVEALDPSTDIPEHPMTVCIEQAGIRGWDVKDCEFITKENIGFNELQEKMKSE